MVHFSSPPKSKFTPRIVVFGVGGGGGNAIDNMIAAGLEGVEFVVANTDAQALEVCRADRKIQIGVKITEGLGAGSDPEIGAAAAEESLAEIADALDDANMLFLTAGMGGGTGTGAIPVIARLARERELLTVGIVTKPFGFEGDTKMRVAEAAIEKLADIVDTLVIVPNQNIFRQSTESTTVLEAYAIVDEVLHAGVSSISDLITRVGRNNLDFNDVRSVIMGGGKAVMGTGEAEGENRVMVAAEAAISNPLLDDATIQGATGLLVNFMGGDDLGINEIDMAMARIKQEISPHANIKHGMVLDKAYEGKVRISVVAAGIKFEENSNVSAPAENLHHLNIETAMPIPDAAPHLESTMGENTPAVDSATGMQSAPPPTATMSESVPSLGVRDDLPGFFDKAGKSAGEEADQPVRARQMSFLKRVFSRRKTEKGEPPIEQSVSDMQDVPDASDTQEMRSSETPQAEPNVHSEPDANVMAKQDGNISKLPPPAPSPVPPQVMPQQETIQPAAAIPPAISTPDAPDGGSNYNDELEIPQNINRREQQENIDTSPPAQTDIPPSGASTQFEIDNQAVTPTAAPIQPLLGETPLVSPQTDAVSSRVADSYSIDNTEIPAFLRRR